MRYIILSLLLVALVANMLGCQLQAKNITAPIPAYATISSSQSATVECSDDGVTWHVPPFKIVNGQKVSKCRPQSVGEVP